MLFNGLSDWIGVKSTVQDAICEMAEPANNNKITCSWLPETSRANIFALSRILVAGKKVNNNTEKNNKNNKLSAQIIGD